MSTQEHIYLRVSMPPNELAAELASMLGMELTRDAADRVYLGRPARLAEGVVGGEVYGNFTVDPDAALDEESFTDSFPMMFDVGFTGGDRSVQLEEAKLLFVELSDKYPATMALVRGFDMLIAVSSERAGLRWMPENTTPYAPDRSAWLAYQE
ncbi:hypothetical protein [Mangrovihabitans endophyticus]|uniref:Uncharacterized protein n=1 Tax=Mangrovihabitans endophyticus TaxID=1751298 RepID=A0A8J3FP58_9ACTN|nr:hypothetical protein [Mangrovihabitans endophyticus]GGK87007.1 hypothetical protein GCM10012284_21400 [Mangrovihabitans endophyticus]